MKLLKGELSCRFRWSLTVLYCYLMGCFALNIDSISTSGDKAHGRGTATPTQSSMCALAVTHSSLCLSLFSFFSPFCSPSPIPPSLPAGMWVLVCRVTALGVCQTHPLQAWDWAACWTVLFPLKCEVWSCHILWSPPHTHTLNCTWCIFVRTQMKYWACTAGLHTLCYQPLLQWV